MLATSKGLVTGSLSYRTAQGIEVDCARAVNGEAIPQDVEGISDVKSDARFLLVVEKDATFQKLLDEDVLNTLHPFILLTGKGVPDLNTRQFLHRMWRELTVPVFALVDADPFGVEIMCTYRFGSLSMAWCCEETAVPALRWLGVHPSDYGEIDQDHLKELSRLDQAKIKSLLRRPYIQDIPELRRQLELMQETNLKAEIQSQESPLQYVVEQVKCGNWV